jgi:hypothetical protein
MILTLLSITLTNVCSETNDAGDVDSEYEGSGVSGVVRGVRYAFAGFVGIDMGGGWPLMKTLDLKHPLPNYAPCLFECMSS